MSAKNFLELPAEMLYLISAYLDGLDLANLSMTCLQMNELCKYRKLWRRVDLRMRSLFPNAMNSIAAKNIVVLNLSEAKVCVKYTFAKEACGRCDIFEFTNLKELHLGNATICTRCTASILCGTQSLVKLNFDKQRLTEGTLVGLINNTNMEVLSLSGCYVEYNRMCCIVAHLSRLEHLNLRKIQNLQFSRMCNNFSRNLLTLDISHTGVTDTDICHVSWRCLKLNRIDISDCPNLTENATFWLRSLKHLRGIATWNNNFDIVEINVMRLKVIGFEKEKDVTLISKTGHEIIVLGPITPENESIYKEYLYYDFDSI